MSNSGLSINISYYLSISRFDMSLRRRTGSGQTDTQLKLHKPTMAISYTLRMCAPHVDSTNPGRSNLVFRSKPIGAVHKGRPQRRGGGLVKCGLGEEG